MMKTKKKRLAFYIDSMDIGGTEKALLDLVNNLSEEKYDIAVIQMAPGGKYNKLLKNTIHKKQILFIGPYQSFRFYWWGRTLLEKIPLKLAHKMLIGDGFDVEIACGYRYPTRIVSQAAKAKKVSWIHMDVSLDKNEVAEMSCEEAKEYFKGIDKFVCVSKDCERKFNDKFHFEDRTEVCYNIVSSHDIIEKSKEKPQIRLDSSYFNMVAIGRLTWQKGFDLLIQDMECIVRNHPNVRLYILGIGDDKEQLEQLIAEKNLGEYIKMPGYVENPYAVLRQADLYVCSSRHESFSLTTAESIVLEVPVISTRCTGPVELLDEGKYGILVHQEELAQTIIELLDNEERYNYYKEKVKERKEFFNITKSIQRWEELIDEL